MSDELKKRYELRTNKNDILYIFDNMENVSMSIDEIIKQANDHYNFMILAENKLLELRNKPVDRVDNYFINGKKTSADKYIDALRASHDEETKKLNIKVEKLSMIIRLMKQTSIMINDVEV